LLHQSEELATELSALMELPPYDNSPRITSSRTLCGVSFDHTESVRDLITTGNFTSSLGVLRMQYESLVKAIWALYAASENSISKLQSNLDAGAPSRVGRNQLALRRITLLRMRYAYCTLQQMTAMCRSAPSKFSEAAFHMPR
jgi:hypothetical protein